MDVVCYEVLFVVWYSGVARNLTKGGLYCRRAKQFLTTPPRYRERSKFTAKRESALKLANGARSTFSAKFRGKSSL